MQLVGYRTAAEEGGPALLVSDGGRIVAESLDPGRELAFALGPRRCAGAVHDGRHLACENSAAPYCPEHSHTWVCARCTGSCLKDEMDCYEEHAVYLAAFAPATFKVGVTRLWRLETRLREQGADRGAHVRTVENGRVAREIESELAADVGDVVRVETKRRGLHREVDEDAWTALREGFDVQERFDFDYGLALDERPMAETLAAGTVRGTKGRLLVLDRPGGTYAVDMRDLVGHELEPGRPDRDVQSTLGAFG